MDSKKQTDKHREIRYVEYQQHSIHTSIVYDISHKQFTVLSPDTTQNFKFIQYCILYFTFCIITTKITNIHVKFFTQAGTFMPIMPIQLLHTDR